MSILADRRALAGAVVVEAVERVREKKLRPTTPAELWHRLDGDLGVRLPRRACGQPGHVAPADAVADAYFGTSSMAIWIGSRGFAGKSYALAALALAEAAYLGAEVRVLGGSAEQSENVVRYTTAWTERPAIEWMLADRGAGREAGVTRSRVRFAGGGMVDALAASSRAVRGPHPTRLRVDEADELDIRILDAALGQTMSRPGVPAQTIVSSTHHYPDGTMTEILRRAADRGWPIYRWCYRCTMAGDGQAGGWLDPIEVERKRGEVPSTMWAAEYDLQEPQPESRAFATAQVEAMFDPALGEYDGAPSEAVIVEPPQEGAWYTTGADWAKERDWTVIATLRCDTDPVRLVAYERIARMPWPHMVARFDQRVTDYPGVAAFDATGIGNVVSDLLTVGALPIVLTGRQRSDLLTRYLVAVEGGRIVAPRIAHAYAEHRFASVDDLFGAGHLPDSICAMALAWLGAASRMEVQWL